MNRFTTILTSFFVFVGITLCFSSALAVTVTSGDLIRIDFQGENETRVVTGRNVELSGESEGDVYVFAASLVSKATIHGDLIVFAGEALVTGEVLGHIRGATGSVTLNNKARNLTMAAGKFNLGERSEIQDAFVAAGESSLQGTMRDLTVAGGTILLNADIKENTKIAGDQVSFGPAAIVGGDLSVKTKEKPAAFDSVPVSGRREFQEVKSRHSELNFFDVILKIFSLLALVYVLWSLPGVRGSILSFQPSTKNILLPILWAILIPIAMIILLATMIGIPLMFLLGFLALVGVIAAKAFAIIFLGSMLSAKLNLNIHLTLVGGSVLITLLALIPLIGSIIALILCLLGWAIAVHLFKTAVK